MPVKIKTRSAVSDPAGAAFLETTRRITERTNAVTEVKAYSNAGKVELWVNGTSKGLCQNDGNAVFVWKGVKLSSGENRIEAKAHSGGKTLTDECMWTLKN